MLVNQSEQLQTLLKSNKNFRKSFEGLCERFRQRVIVWTPQVCSLARTMFSDLFRAYGLNVTVEVSSSYDGDGKLTIYFH
jgi:hypothetical protein